MNNDNRSVLQALRRIPLWNNLLDKELEEVYHHCKPAVSAAGETVFKEGDPSHHLYILLSGKINIVTEKKGIIHTVNEFESFGEIGLITQRTRSASAISADDCKMLSLHHVDFNTMLGTQPRVSAIMMRNITTSLSQHIIRMNHQELEHIPNDLTTEDIDDIEEILSVTLTQETPLK